MVWVLVQPARHARGEQGAGQGRGGDEDPVPVDLERPDLEGDRVDHPADSSADDAGSGSAASGKVSRSRRTGKRRIQTPVTTSVAAPPNTTARTRPNQAAVTPDSNSPSSFEAPMKTALTALTRPRISSGVSSCTSRWRT